MVPVIVLTGFLGSGKTTLLNRLFRERPPGRGRFAIVVNEFGAVGIDADLLPSDATRQVELPGGCICCQLVGELETTLVELLASAPDLECVLIETTGIAEPLPISWTLAGEALAPLTRLAAIVTVVDPVHHLAWRGESPSVDNQVEYADLLVLSKLDEASPSDALVDALRGLNELAPIIAEPPERVATVLWRYLDDPELTPRGAGPGRSSGPERAHGHGRGHGGGGTTFDSVALPAPDLYDLEELVSALEDLPPGVIRLKGIVRAIDTESGATAPALFVVHRVGARVSTAPYDGEAVTRIVAIGRRVESDWLADCLASAVVTS